MTDQDSADQIERTPGSFGVTSYSLVVSEKRNIRPLAVDGVSPVGKNGVNERYPYFITFHLVYMKDRATGAAGDFIDFVHSREGGKILGMSGHLPIGKAEDQP
jgi:phosphate transport system substrate-binding protein